MKQLIFRRTWGRGQREGHSWEGGREAEGEGGREGEQEREEGRGDSE